MCRCSLWATVIPGYAQSQDIAEGTKVKRGSVIRISFVSSGGVEAAGNTSTNSEE